jgi:purine nucleosidase
MLHAIIKGKAKIKYNMKPFFSLFFFSIIIMSASAQKKKIILDADTGNEMDDLYSIVSVLFDGKADVLALNSAHFNNVDLLVDSFWHVAPTKGLNTVIESQRFNELLLKHTGKENIPHPLGANRMVGLSWGLTTPRPSAAAQKIIDEVKKLPAGEMLDILTLGAVTNIASAIQLDTTIVKKIRVYMLGARYYADKKVWDKDEFNIRNDLNGFNYLLNHPILDLHIMPVNVAFDLKFRRETCNELLSKPDSLSQLLLTRWDEVHAGNQWIMWDLALVDAYLHPEWATEISCKTPPENRQRVIKVYSKIKSALMEGDFWKKIQQFQREAK